MMQTIKRHWKLFTIVFIYVAFEATVRSTSLIMEYQGRGDPLEAWKPFVWEYSSIFVVFLMVPFILMFDERYPISSNQWWKRLAMHIPVSMVFSLFHVGGMVAVRKIIFLLMDETYIFSELNYTIIYEYRKDVMTYSSILIVIYVYREILRLRNGEAQFEKAKEDHSEDKRILVSKAGTFNFISPSSIDWVEAAGNYVELHVGDQTYMLRATMKDIATRLGDIEFARIHRSTIVKKDQVDQIKPAMNGDQNIILKNGEELRLSRRYKENLSLQ